VQDLMHRNAFTDWDQYGKDTVIEWTTNEKQL
jgi:hypothetical protein